MESELPETVKAEQDDSTEDLSSMDMKIEHEDMYSSEHAIKREMDDEEALKETFSLPIKAETDSERVSVETNFEELFEIAGTSENMESKDNTTKRENDDKEALIDPVFVPVNVDFDGTLYEVKEEIFEESESTEGCANEINRQPYVECSFRITSSSPMSLPAETVGMSTDEHLSKNCFSSELQCQKSFAVASCSTATWGYLSERQEKEQVAEVREMQQNNQKAAERDASVEDTLCQREMQTSALIASSSEECETQCTRWAFECSICKAKFPSRFLVDEHFWVHNKNNRNKCSLCEKSFSQGAHLTRHMRSHTGEKPYKCSQCEKSFRQSGHLTKHMHLHTGEKPYKCSLCDKLFSLKGSLTVHMHLHSGKKPYKCSHCDKSFSVKGNLTNHLRLHTGEKPYKCSQCDKSFSAKSNLTNHMMLHTGEKPYKCTECDKSFRMKTKLTKHMRFHTGEKIYKCSQCEKSFCQKGTLTRHLRFHTGKKPYKCEQCEKTFHAMWSLTRHMRSHTGEKPYKCSQCKKSFGESCSLARHMRSHSGERSFK